MDGSATEVSPTTPLPVTETPDTSSSVFLLDVESNATLDSILTELQTINFQLSLITGA